MHPTSISNLQITYISEPPKNIDFALFERPHFRVSEDQFYLHVYNQAQFYVERGEVINIFLEEGSDKDSVELFLNGSVQGAVLLQRKILAFHGSSFNYKGAGIIICGNSGAGKSSITAAFCQNGAQFISDDITPVSVKEGEVYINPLKTEIKLWDDAFEQLNISPKNLRKIRPTFEKFYYPFESSKELNSSLHLIIILDTHNKDEFSYSELTGINKFKALKNQIYRKLYLNGMPKAEQSICIQLLSLGKKVRVLHIIRPKICSIHQSMDFIKQKITDLLVINEEAI